MFLKNYTSNVPVSTTIVRIEAVLIRCCVNSISKEYDPSGNVAALIFKMPVGGKMQSVRFPVDADKATDVLWENYQEEHPKIRQGRKERVDFCEQGNRTAWKIAQDWIEVEMSRIQMRQAEPLEIFLCYVWNGEQTVFQRLQEGRFRGLLAEKSES